MALTPILGHLANGATKKRVGFLVEGRAPVREGAEIADQQGNPVGVITSGGFGPSLQAPVAMGYVPVGLSAVGTQLTALVRGKPRSITRRKNAFSPTTILSRLTAHYKESKMGHVIYTKDHEWLRLKTI